MASPNSILPPRTPEEQDSRYNPYEQAQKEQGTGYTSSGVDQAEAFANDPNNSTEVARKAEENVAPSQESQQGFYRTKNSKNKLSFRGRATNFVKKRGAIFGILGVLGIGGAASIGFFGPITMLQNLTDNLTIANDSVSPSIQKRIMGVFGKATVSTPDQICANTTRNIKCKMGRISNKALIQLQERANIRPVFADGVTNTDGKTGYPSQNPTHYDVPNKDGGTDRVVANQLTSHLAKKENAKLANTVFGRGGAFYVRMMAMSGGKFNKFLGKYGLQKNGGLADGNNKKGTVAERLLATREKLKATQPSGEKIATTASKEVVKGTVDKHINRAKKGGLAYQAAYATCILVKIPSYAAMGAAAVQTAQVMPVAWNAGLAPGSKQRASGVETENAITQEDQEAIATLFTDRTPRESDGKLSAAFDSPILLSAMAVNKGQPTLSESYTPGLSILRSPIVQASQSADKASEPACNVIMSPAALYTAIAVDSAITIGTSATIVGGIIKVAGSAIISVAAGQVASAVAESLIGGVLTDLAKNDKILTAKGQDFGDVFGISALTFFASNGMSRNLPVLKKSQLAGFAQIKQENEAFERQMAVASLSPFDTSSRYTFLGSIVHNLQNTAMASGSYSALSTIGSIPSMIGSTLMPQTFAASNQTQESCGYAKEFGLSAENPADDPAINAAGLPCTGLTAEQGSMSPDEAVTLLANEGWIDIEKEVPENASVETLRSSGIIKEDTLMTDFIDSCSDSSTGEYIINAASCTVSGTGSGSITPGCDTGNNACVDENDDEAAGGSTLNDAKAISAISVFLLDFQIHQSMNGEDVIEAEATPGTSAPATGRPDGAIDKDRGWTLAKGVDYSKYPCDPRTIDRGVHTNATEGFTIRRCQITHNTGDNDTNGTNQVASVVSTNLMNMLEAARAAGVELGISDGLRLTFDRGYYSEHITGLAVDLGAPRAGATICFGGDSQNGYGNQANAEAACQRKGGVQNEAYQWLKANAANYGYYNYVKEPWHWSTSGS
jgi:hypothetical protein